MVAAGMGITLVPRLSVPPAAAAGDKAFVRYLPFDGDPPTRRVVLAWRRSFTRYEAITSWYSGFDSYVIAGPADLPIYCPSMGRRIPNEEKLGIQHLPY